MKNLKQVLALGMAFSLTMSTMAGAAFTDQDKISASNSDAVELLTTLDVIQGNPDGSFDPQGTVTRAQMAKMIYTIRNGGNDNADAYKSVSTTFTDISGHWAEGYIKYLQSTGIIAGKSATIFDPDATVTTAEAMKMALVLGGYRSDKANLEGATWFNNTVSLATTNKLTDDVGSAMDGGCTRQDAAQILANALGMTAVQWSEFTQSFLNDSDDGLSLGGEKITVGYKWMDLTTYVGQLVSSGDMILDGVVDADGNPVNAAAGKDRFTIDVDTKNDKATSGVITFKDGMDHTDLVGQEVKILTGDKVDEVYGVYATGTSQVVETTMDKITVDTANNKFEIGGTKYTVDDSTVKVYNEGAYAGPSGFTTVITNNGQAVSDKVKLVDWDNNGKYESVMVETVAVAEITYVGTESITIGQIGSRSATDVLPSTKKVIENSEMSIYDGAAKGDYVVITKDDYNNDTWKVEKATVVTGAVDGVVKNERKVRVDGTWYTLANTKSGTPYILRTVNGSKEDFVNKDKVTLYVVGDIAYYAESTKGNDVNRSVAMIYDTKMKAGDWNNSAQAKIILPDGTTKTVNVDSIDGQKPTVGTGDVISNLDVSQMYKYTINNDGDYQFTSLADGGEMAGYKAYKTDTDGISNDKYYGGAGTNGGYIIADDAIVFAYLPDGSAKVYTGKAVKDAKIVGTNASYGGALIDEISGINYVRIMNIKLSSSEQINSATNYGYLVTDGVRSNDSEGYFMEYQYWNGTEIVTVKERTFTNKEDWAVKGTVISFANDGEGLVKDVTNVQDPDEVAAVDLLKYASMTGANADDGYVTMMYGQNASETLKVTSDTIIYYVNSDKNEPEKVGVSGTGYDYYVQPVVNGKHPVNVAYVRTSDGNVKFMVIDVDGQMAGKTFIADASYGLTEINAELASGKDVTISGDIGVNGTLDVKANTTLTVEGTLTIDNMPTVASTGNIVADTIDATGVAGITASDIEELLKYAEEVVVNGTIFNSLTRSLVSLEIPKGKTMTVEGDAALTNIALTVKGKIAATGDLTVKAGSTVVLDVNASIVVDKDMLVENTASVSVANGATVSVVGDLDNQGTMTGEGEVTENDGDTYTIKPDVQATKVVL